MKKWVVLVLAISFVGAHAMQVEGEETQTSNDMKELETGVASLSLADENKQLTEEQPNLYIAMAALYKAAGDADIKRAKEVIDKGWRNNHFYRKLTKSNKLKLAQQFAHFKDIVGDKFPCSPAWVALEFALDAFKKGEKERHAKLVEIVKIIIEPQDTHWEPYPLRKNYPINCGWYFICCCLTPLCCAYIPVHGYATHRVAQTNDCILMDALLKKYIIEDGDSEECTPLFYAVTAGAKEQVKFLVGRGANVNKIKALTCGCCWSCYTKDPDILDFIKDQPGYTEHCTC